MSGLQILEIKTPNKKPVRPLPPAPLPPACFLMGIVSPPRSGKSALIMNLIANSGLYGRDYFDAVIYCSPSQNFDETTRHVLPKLDFVTQVDDMDMLENCDTIIRGIMMQQAKDGVEDRKNILIVLDDMSGTLQKNKQLCKLATKYRHYGISIIVSVQHYKSIPTMIRTSMTCFIHFHIPNEVDYKKMCEEIHCQFKNGAEMGEMVTQKRYSFAYINLERADFYDNFQTCLYSRDTDPDLN
jgi:hypothetical protein